MADNWHDTAFFGLHFDIHATQEDILLGRDAHRAELLKEFQKVKPDFVQCDCKGHPGITSWPTKTGVAAKGIVKDALKEWRAATREMGIPLIMHYSGVWDTAALKLHPDWSRVDADGNRDENNTCPLSDYTEHYMIPQLRELITEYDIDGFWVDGENWASFPCYCSRCTEAFLKETGFNRVPRAETEAYWPEWLEFNRKNFVRHVTLYSNAIHAQKQSCTSCSNWMYTVRQPDPITAPVDYISGDFSWIWSCANALTEAKFLDTRGKKWDLMAWAFTSYGPMHSWVFKSTDALCQEAGVVLSHGGAFTIYDTPNRWGSLVSWHMDDLAVVAEFCRRRQEFSQNSTQVPQAMVLLDTSHYYSGNSPLFNYGKQVQPVEGALHALGENGVATGILNDFDAMEKLCDYPLCVVPEQTKLSSAMEEKLLQYVQEGGNLILSGSHTCMCFAAALGVEISGETTKGYGNVDYLGVEVQGRTAPLIGPWLQATNRTADIQFPLLGSRDSGEYRRETGFAAATVKTLGKGKIAGLYGGFFDGYYLSHYPLLREFLGMVLDAMAPEKLIRLSCRSRLNMSLREKEGMLLLHLVNLSCDPATSPGSSGVEYVPHSAPVQICVPMEQPPKDVRLVPDSRNFQWTYNDSSLKIELPYVAIHDIFVIEP